jgi:hypothetical protein
MKGVTLPNETVFVMEMSPIKFGLGATEEIGFDARRLGLRKVLIVTDPGLAALGPAGARPRAARRAGRQGRCLRRRRRRADRSLHGGGRGVRRHQGGRRLRRGGRRERDRHRKAVNLLSCYPAPLLDYVNKPVGRGAPVPGPLKPLIAMPTTAGTGSETTAVAVTHVMAQHVKAGISSRLLRRPSASSIR